MLVFRTKSVTANDPSFWPSFWTTNNRYEVVEAYMPEFRALRKNLSPGDRVLDAGCGIGYVTHALNAGGYHAVGIDFDAVSVLAGSKRLGYFPVSIADVTRLPHGNGVFDAVFLSSVAEHVPSGAEVAIQECARVLRPGGRMVLTLPYMNVVRKLYAPFHHLREVWRVRLSPRPFDQFVYTRGEVMTMLHDSGFRVLECRRSHYITVLLRIPGVRTLHRRVFGASTPRPAAGNGTAGNKPGSAAATPSRGGARQTVKKAMEGTLNLLIPNRLTVIAEKNSK